MGRVEEETRFIMKKYHISANKSLGQNFLVDDMVIENIITSAKITKSDLVIEIGPGLGVLTKELLERAGKVIAVELDEKMITILKDRFLAYSNLAILHQDILKVELKKLIEEEKKGEIKNVKIVANLPYYITTPILMKLLEEKLDIQSITVMVQKEVADRLIAIPGEKLAGAITYTVYYYATSEKVVEVPNTAFIPSPEVASQVIHLYIRKEPAIQVRDEAFFFRLIKTSFMQRRKTLINAITNGGICKEKTKIKEILEKLEIQENARGETLSIEQFAKIADLLS